MTALEDRPDVAALIARLTDGWPEERKQELAAELRRQAHALRYPTPLDLACALDPSYVRTPALELLNDALVETLTMYGGRLIITMPPQEGKSTLMRWAELWLLLRHPEWKLAVASYAQGLASEHGKHVRDAIILHGLEAAEVNGEDVLGLRVSPRSSSVARWDLDGHRGGMLCVGLTSGFTGKPADALTVDDPFSGPEQADSETYRQRVWNFWTGVGRQRLSPGGPVVVIMTRWHQDDLVARLLAEDAALPPARRQWRLIHIPAQCEDPAVDPLGRAKGEFMLSARGRTDAEWAQIRQDVGARHWAAEYQGNPTPAQGGIFHWDWIRPFRAKLADVPVLSRTVVAVDTTGGGNDEAGIIVTGRGTDRRTYVLADLSAHHTLGGQWRAAWLACLDFDADALVYEANFVDTAMRKAIPQAWRRIAQQARALHAAGAGGLVNGALDVVLQAVADQLSGRLVDPDAYVDDEQDTPDGLVEQLRELLPYMERVLRAPEHGPCPLQKVWASKGKRTRAEPVAVAYETGQVSHVGVFPALEQEMVSWQEGQDSPNRIDANVWAWFALNSVGGPGTAAAAGGSIPTGAAGLTRR